MRLFDLHCDTLTEGLHKGWDFPHNTGAVDLCRGSVYHPWIQAFAAWMPDTLRGEPAQRECAALLDVAQSWESRYPHNFHIIRSGQDIEKPYPGCHALLTVEGGGALGSDPEIIDWLHAHHVQAVTLTWDGDNFWASGCEGDQRRGLTTAGRMAIRRMEEQHITVDISHLNETGFWEVCRVARQPFIASHSLSAAVHPHRRNLTDAQFAAIRDRGGLVGISLCGAHLGKQSFSCIEKHLQHFLSINGAQTVCFGCDMDGTELPEEWNGIAVMEALYNWLQKNGYDQRTLDAVFYGNACRFFTERIKKQEE